MGFFSIVICGCEIGVFGKVVGLRSKFVNRGLWLRLLSVRILRSGRVVCMVFIQVLLRL